MPGSGELVAVWKVVAGVQTAGQIEHQVMKGGMLEDLRVRQRRMATRPLLTAPERAVQIQHHVAEHVAHQQQPQEVVTEELQYAGLYELRDQVIIKLRDIEQRERFSGRGRPSNISFFF